MTTAESATSLRLPEIRHERGLGFSWGNVPRKTQKLCWRDVVCSARSSTRETILHGRLVQVRILSHNRKGLRVTPSVPLLGETRRRLRDRIPRVLSSCFSLFHLLFPGLHCFRDSCRKDFTDSSVARKRWNANRRVGQQDEVSEQEAACEFFKLQWITSDNESGRGSTRERRRGETSTEE